MKMLLGLVFLSFAGLMADSHTTRVKAELNHAVQERDRLNGQIAQKNEELSRAQSDERVRAMQATPRTVAGRRTARRARAY